MDKKMYNKPDMKVVLMRHRTSLLTGSTDPEPDPSVSGGASIQNVTMNDTWDETDI